MQQSEIAELAEKDYIAGMKYREIADKYEVSVDTVKSWKKRKGWVRPSKDGNSRDTKKCVHPKSENVCTQKNVVQQYENTPSNLPEGISEKHLMFCVYYVKSYNATKAYQKVYGCDYYSAAVSANRLLKNVDIQNCIRDMQAQQMENAMLKEEDVVQKYIDIAFSDTNDFVQVINGKVVINENLDGTVVKGIKQGKFGIEVQMYDRMKALDKLMDHLERQKARNPDTEGGGGIVEIVQRVELEEPENEQCDMDSAT